MKRSLFVYITICKMDSQQEFAVWLRKLKRGLCINLEEWDGAGDGREFQKGGGICIPMADRFDRKQKNSVKQLSFNKKIKRKKNHINHQKKKCKTCIL